MSTDPLTQPNDGRPTPRRIYNGVVIIFAGALVMYMPYLVWAMEANEFGAIDRVIQTFPVAASYALFALGFAHIVLGCIDYARAPRN